MEKTIRFSRIVQLSHVITPEIPVWPGDPPLRFETIANLTHNGYSLRQFTMGEHSATHLNAPSSFFPEGIGVDRYAPEALVIPAVVLDIRQQAEENTDYALTREDVLAWEQAHGKIPPKRLVLLYTGWQAKWSHPTAFLNQDETEICHFPGFGAEATQFLLQHRQIAGVGIDTHGVDPGTDLTYATNRQVLARQGIVLENLTNLDRLPPAGITVVIGILPLQGGSGSPASVLAFVA